MKCDAQAASAPAADERCDDVIAVVVTYNPGAQALRELLGRLLEQVASVVVVDNGSQSDVARYFPPERARIALVRNDQNLGIAAAQNLGIARAVESAACRFVLLSDDDSLPAPGMLRRLRGALAAADAGAPVAAAGPLTIDMRTGEGAAIIVDNGGRRKRRIMPVPRDTGAKAPTTTNEVAFLISSGTLIPVAVLRALGGMRSNYFIDHVDTEWCLRARAAGYRLLIVPEAQLHHRLGDSVEQFWFLRSRPVATHAPLRDYYLFRNTLLMQRDVPMSSHWRARELLRLVLFAGYFLTFGDQRWERLRHMWLGLRHGRAGMSGRLRAGSGVCEAVPVSALDPAV